MDLSCLMVYAQEVEETRLKKKNKNAKKTIPYDGGNSKSKFEIQDKPRFKKRFSNPVPPNVPRSNKDTMSNPEPQGEKLVVHQVRAIIVPIVARGT